MSREDLLNRAARSVGQATDVYMRTECDLVMMMRRSGAPSMQPFSVDPLERCADIAVRDVLLQVWEASPYEAKRKA